MILIRRRKHLGSGFAKIGFVLGANIGTPASTGTRPWAAKAAIISTAATLEWMSHVKITPSRKAVM